MTKFMSYRSIPFHLCRESQGKLTACCANDDSSMITLERRYPTLGSKSVRGTSGGM
jgi:hypothetical protein